MKTFPEAYLEPYFSAKQQFKVAVQMLYDNGPLDIQALEAALDEVTFFFDIQLTPGDLNIQRAPKRWTPIDPLEYNKIFEGMNL